MVFYKIILRARLQSLGSKFVIIIFCQNNDRRARGLPLNFANGIKPIAIGKIHIQQNDVNLILFDIFNALLNTNDMTELIGTFCLSQQNFAEVILVKKIVLH